MGTSQLITARLDPAKYTYCWQSDIKDLSQLLENLLRSLRFSNNES